MTKLFGTDGIRGIANAYPMDGQTAMAVGSAVATFFRSTAPDRNVVPIGQDTRLSGDMIANAVSAGICSAGLNVSLLGVVPTPAVAFFARTLDDAAGGIVISASHNPYSDNGIKVFDSKGTKLSDADETLIEHQLAGGLGKYSEPEHSVISNRTNPAIGEQRIGLHCLFAAIGAESVPKGHENHFGLRQWGHF
jgi:phosphoglucosamine mutase